MTIEIDKIAPSFNLPCDDGTKIDLSDLRGKNVVLYFYPKDDTPGCTIEAQDFNADIEEFKKLDAIILGASRDSVKKHIKFIDKYSLGFNLLSDEESTLCDSYGVLKEKSMFGKKYIGIDRSTFIIDKKGNVAKVFRSVKINGHVKEILEFLKELEK
jgi:peroxiredoxin Q/BCP